MKRFFIFILASIVLAGAYSTFFASSANAASQYDNSLRTHSSSELRTEQSIQGPYTTAQLGEQLVNGNWYSGGYGSCNSDFKNQFIQHIQNGGRYFVVQNDGSWGNGYYTSGVDVFVDFSNTQNYEFQWGSNFVDYRNLDGGTVHYLRWENYNTFRCYQYPDNNGYNYARISTAFRNTDYWNGQKLVEYSNATLTYPTDYAGETLEPIGSGEQKQQRRPNFTYQLNNKSITAIPYSAEPPLPDFTPELDAGYTFEGYYISWNVWKCPEGGYDTTGQVCNGGSPALFETKLLPNEDEYKVDVQDYGTYQFEAEYWVKQCYRYPSYPTTPDYCFYSKLRAHFKAADFEYINTYVVMDVDGRSITGDTTNLVCTEGGFCQPTTAICIGKDNFIDRLNCELQGNLSIGLLNPSLNAVKQLVNGVVVPSNPNCNVPLTNISITGQTFPLSQLGSQMCSSSTKIHNAFPIISIATNAILSLSILAFIINRVNRLLDNNKHDVLEKV